MSRKQSSVYAITGDSGWEGPFVSVRDATKNSADGKVVVRVYGKVKVNRRTTKTTTLEAFNGKAN